MQRETNDNKLIFNAFVVARIINDSSDIVNKIYLSKNSSGEVFTGGLVCAFEPQVLSLHIGLTRQPIC